MLRPPREDRSLVLRSLVAIAAKKSVEEIRQYLELDTLYYLSLEGLVEATGQNASSFCLACFNGQYPIEPDPIFHKLALG